MQTIDFTKGIGYKIDHFPDGEKHLVIDELNKKDTVEVICRIKSSDDLFLLMQLKDILDRQWITIEKLTIKYLMGMRMDRLMDLNGSITLKIVTEVINNLGAKKVEIIEVHSDKTIELINNSKSKIIKNFPINSDDYILCYPDRGAENRYNTYFDYCLICDKTRGVDGKIINVRIININEYYEKGDIIVTDDICDGGGTFLAIAPKLREFNPSKLILCVTHAIQKIGIERVAEVYDEVYITNSYHDWDKEDLPSNVFVRNI